VGEIKSGCPALSKPKAFDSSFHIYASNEGIEAVPQSEANVKRMAVLRQMLKESKMNFAVGSPKNEGLQSMPPCSDEISAQTNGTCRCNCRKSGCLKMYCECFRQKGYCEGCNCVGCMNTPQFEHIRRETMQAIKSKNPFAFEKLVVIKTKENDMQRNKSVPMAQHIKGCRCKKTNCKKKYCECFQLGVLCGPDCQCTGCLNCTTTNCERIKGRKLFSEDSYAEPKQKLKIVLQECAINIKL